MAAGLIIMMNMQGAQRRLWEAEARLVEWEAKRNAVAKAVSERPEFQAGIVKAQAILKGMAGSVKSEIDPDMFMLVLTAKKKGFWSELFNRVATASSEEVSIARCFAADYLESTITQIANEYPAGSQDVLDLAREFSYPGFNGTAENYLKPLKSGDYERFGVEAYEQAVRNTFWQINNVGNQTGMAATIMDRLTKQTDAMDYKSAAYAMDAFRSYAQKFTNWLAIGGGLLSPEERSEQMRLIREESRRQLKEMGWNVS